MMGIPKGFKLGDFEYERPRRSTSSKPVAYADTDSNLEEEEEEDMEEWESEEETPKAKRSRKKTSQIKKRKRAIVSDSESDEMELESEEEEEDSEEDSDYESMARRRTDRNVQRKQYVYDDDSDEFKESDDEDDEVEEYEIEEVEEEDPGDTIELVCNYRTRKLEENEVESIKGAGIALNVNEYEVKWLHKSYMHNTWHTSEELIDRKVKGWRKIVNFEKRRKVEQERRKYLSLEEIEQEDINNELEHRRRDKYILVDRVISKQENEEDDNGTEYLVKWCDLTYADCTWEKDEDIKTFQRKIDEFLEREANPPKPNRSNVASKFRKMTEQPEWLTAGELRDYQLTGVNWMLQSYHHKRNVILADEMGLGKTIQTICFVAALHVEYGNIGPHLVVVPLSTIAAWRREFAKWAPWLNVIEYGGSRVARQTCRDYEFYTDGTRTIKFHVLLCHYEVITADRSGNERSPLSSIRWKYLLVDEAHRLKDSNSKLYQNLAALRTTNRLLITGTPIQNRMNELWCLLHFLEPQKFHSLEEFHEQFGEITQGHAITELHSSLVPHLLRRTKKDVLKSLPSKTERILRVGMSAMQKRYYRWILTKNFAELNKGVRGKASSLTNIVMELKKCTNHPYLFEGAEDASLEDSKVLPELIRNSGKMVILDKLLQRLKETGHRVLVFSQMVRMLDILADYLTYRRWGFRRLDGTMKAADRQIAMDHFNAPDSSDFCFLLSTRAGGLGINLASADTVIIFDSDYNPQNDLQAEARAHRIGQKNAVNIYRLVTRDSIEEKILERAKEKMILNHLVIQQMDTSGTAALLGKKRKADTGKYDKQELTRILEFGAQALFDEEKENEMAKASGNQIQDADDDLDDILARAETSDLNQLTEADELLGAFKVANFDVDEENEEDQVKESESLKKEDGKFWEKVIPLHMRAEAAYQEELAMGVRAARQGPKIYSESRIDAPQGSASESSRPRKKRKNKSAKNTPVSEAKKIYASMLKYGSPERAAKRLLSDETDKAKFEQLKKIAEEMLEKCRLAREESTKGKIEVEYEEMKLDAVQLLDRVEGLTQLSTRVESIDSPYENFRFTGTVPSVRWPNCAWGIKQDAMLLLGIYENGFGSWREILADARLGLGEIVGHPPRVTTASLGNRAKRLMLIWSNPKASSSRPSGKKRTKIPVRQMQPETPSKSSRESEMEDLFELNDAALDWAVSAMKEEDAVGKAMKRLKKYFSDHLLLRGNASKVRSLYMRVGNFVMKKAEANEFPIDTLEDHLWYVVALCTKSTRKRARRLYVKLRATESEKEAIKLLVRYSKSK